MTHQEKAEETWEAMYQACRAAKGGSGKTAEIKVLTLALEQTAREASEKVCGAVEAESEKRRTSGEVTSVNDAFTLCEQAARHAANQEADKSVTEKEI